MMPWESCPHRLASTRLRATRSASSGGTPPFKNRVSVKDISVLAGKVGTESPSQESAWQSFLCWATPVAAPPGVPANTCRLPL